MNNIIIIYSMIIFIYADSGNKMNAKYNSPLYFSILSFLMYKLNIQMFFNEIFLSYLLWDSIKHLYFEYHGKKYIYYIIHHVSLLLLILIRSPCGDFLRLLQMSEISSIFLNLAFMVEKDSAIYNICTIIFYLLFMHLRVYKIFYQIITTAYNNYYYGALPFFMKENLDCQMNGIDLIILTPVFILHVIWFIELNKKMKRKFIGS